MRTVAQGRTIDLNVQFRLSNGTMVDPTDVHVDVIASTGDVADSIAAPERLAAGSYHVGYVIHADAPLGTWLARWYGTFNGAVSTVDEQFSVVTLAMVADTDAVVTRLRRLIGERIPIGKTENDTRFLDQEIADVYYINGENLDKTLAELWLSKHAYLVDYVDMVESGTSRNLSQMGRAALMQVSKYEARVQEQENNWQATYRSLPRTFSPYDGRDVLSIGAVIIFDDPQRAWTPA